MVLLDNEKVQKYNPHGLTINQHIIPKKCIERFAFDGLVELHDLKRGISRRGAPNDDIFLSKRAWDTRTETVFMKSIEDKYQDTADKLLSGRQVQVHERNKAITEFYSLWCSRFFILNHSVDNSIGSNIKGDDYTKDEQEKIEALGMAFVKLDGTIPDRFINGDQILLRFIYLKEVYSEINWGLVRSEEIEFVCPDNFINFAVIPLTPEFAFIGGSSDGVISRVDVSLINSAARGCAKHFILSRDFTKTY